MAATFIKWATRAVCRLRLFYSLLLVGAQKLHLLCVGCDFYAPAFVQRCLSTTAASGCVWGPCASNAHQVSRSIAWRLLVPALVCCRSKLVVWARAWSVHVARCLNASCNMCAHAWLQYGLCVTWTGSHSLHCMRVTITSPKKLWTIGQRAFPDRTTSSAE